MQNKEAAQLEKAKNYAFLLLKFRPRSEQEIYQRLKQKKFDEKIIKETLSFLKEKDFINDESFAKSWIESRLKRPFGLRRIAQELKLKGIAQQTINSMLSAIKEGYCEEDIVREIARAKFSKAANIQPQTAKRRIFAYLLRRGFSPDVIIEVINNK